MYRNKTQFTERPKVNVLETRLFPTHEDIQMVRENFDFWATKFFFCLN